MALLREAPSVAWAEEEYACIAATECLDSKRLNVQVFSVTQKTHKEVEGGGGKGKEEEGKVRKGGERREGKGRGRERERRKDCCIIVAAYCTICHPPELRTNPLHRTRLQVTPHTLKCV